MCRQEAMLRYGLTQLWQLLRDVRNHARNPAGTREHFETAGDSRWCVQPELTFRSGRSNVIRQPVLATLKIMCREEVGQSLQGRVRFVLRVRLQHGNNRDRSTGAFSARRRGLGIFAVAALKRITNRDLAVLLDPACVMPAGNAAPNLIGNSPLILQTRSAS